MKNFLYFTIILISVFNVAHAQSITLTPTDSNLVTARRFGGLSKPYFSGLNSDGTPVIPTATKTGFTLASLGGYGYRGTSFSTEPNALISLHASNSFTGLSTPTDIRFYTTADNSTILNERMRINADGSVGMGTAQFNTGERLVISNGTTRLSILPGYFDAGLNSDWATIDIQGTTGINGLRIKDNFSVNGSIVGSRIGIGLSSFNADLQFSNTNRNRRIVLYEDANNDQQFMGFGVNAQTLRYQIPSTSNNHVFYAGTSAITSSELMRITGTGNVGIGTNMPTTKLQVFDSNYGISQTNGTVEVSTYLNNTMGWMGTTSNHPFSLFTNDGSPALNIATDRRIATNSSSVISTDGAFQVHPITDGVNPTAYSMTLYHQSNSNKWSLGVFNQGLVLDANGSIKGYFDVSSGVYTTVSDRRLKKEIKPLDDVLSKTLLLKPSTFKFIKEKTEKINTGFIAQEVEPLFPEFVHTTEKEDGSYLKTMDYAGMSVIAIKAIQEQQLEISHLQEQILKLQDEKLQLKSEIKSFESRLVILEKLLVNKK